MLGKQKCRILREIRQQIAQENDIPYVTRDCPHQGDCAGTCPRCESELRYLERQLAAREALGKRVAVTALCAGLSLSAAGCGPSQSVQAPPQEELSGAVAYEETVPPTEEVYVTSGEVAFPEDWGEETHDEPICDGAGDDAIEALGQPFELTGDVYYEA